VGAVVDPATPGAESSKRLLRGYRAVLAVWLAWGVLLSFAYLGRPDGLAGLFIWPAWIWIPVLSPAGLFAPRGKRLRTLLLGGVTWTVLALVFWPDWRAFLSKGALDPGPVRAAFASARRKGEGMRIVSLNCGGGNIQAARDALRLDPDVLLLQESPSRKEVEALAKVAFGSASHAVTGPDASIVCRWPLRAKALPTGTSNVVVAQADAPGLRLAIASLRLSPPVLRLDYWNPECWRAYADNRRERRLELAELWTLVVSQVSADSLVIGGDFNTPADRDVFAPLAATHRDSFKGWDGAGYGATAVNPFPLMVRIDQIWVPKSWDTLRSYAAPTGHSDHRLAVAEVVFDPSATTAPGKSQTPP
jgi:vancomycin resistance protein VanJ